MKNTFPSCLFVWDKERRFAIADVSELVGAGYHFDGNLTPISIESQKTGTTMEFMFEKFDLDGSGEDIMDRRYSATIDRKKWTAIIVND